MVKKNDDIVVTGEVLEVFPNTLFKIQINEQHQVLAGLAGRLRLSNIQIVAGDKVQVVLSPYDLTRGRITWRLREGRTSR